MKMCAPSLAECLILHSNPGDTSSARKARRTVIKDEHRAKAAQRHEVYQERTNKQNDQLKTIKVMKRRNSYIASTLVLALVLMVGFPTSARPQIGKGMVKTPNSYVKIMPSIIKSVPIVERVEKLIKFPIIAVPQPNMNSVASRTHILQLPEAPCPKPAKTASPSKPPHSSRSRRLPTPKQPKLPRRRSVKRRLRPSSVASRPTPPSTVSRGRPKTPQSFRSALARRIWQN